MPRGPESQRQSVAKVDLPKQKESGFAEQRRFILENFPGSRATKEHIVATALEDMDVLEERDSDQDLAGILTYQIREDPDGEKYCTWGVIVVREDVRDGELAETLFNRMRAEAKRNDCSYIVAIAETKDGEKILENLGFTEQDDEVRGRTFFRLDLD